MKKNEIDIFPFGVFEEFVIQDYLHQISKASIQQESSLVPPRERSLGCSLLYKKKLLPRNIYESGLPFLNNCFPNLVSSLSRGIEFYDMSTSETKVRNAHRVSRTQKDPNLPRNRCLGQDN